MTPARFQTIEEIYRQALEQNPGQISAFLDRACKGDTVLRHKVEALLSSRQQADGFIEESAVGLAARIIQNGDANSLVGQTIGHYKISESIGSGGMGEVYLATDIVAGRRAALKLLPLRFTGDAERLKRFEREARAVVALNHPNIVTVYEIGENNSVHYIASELIEGETLRDRLARGPMQLSEALDIAIQVISALAAAHQAGIVHCDVKPENIMLRPDGYAKVLDFGIAKLAESTFTEVMADAAGAITLSQTNVGSILGTARYMSPEQAGGGQVDKRSDIWSLGVVLYETVTGHAPFNGETAVEVMSSILEKEPPPLTRYVAHAPAELQQIVTTMLRKDPAQRYRDADELLNALKHLRRKLEAESERAAAPLPLRWARSPVALVVLLSAALALTFPFFRHRNVTKSSPPSDKSIAVLPFLDLSENKNQEYFCDGMSEEIISALAKVKALRVVSRTSSFSFKGKTSDANEIGKALNVENLLEGSLRREGKRVRVTAELINARSGFHIWTESYDREVADLFSLQDEITRSIVEALKIKLAVALPAQPQRNMEVYDLYLQGLYFSNKSSEADLRRALNFFQRAVEKDPTFSRAWTGVAKVWYFLADVYVKPLEAYPSSKEAALKAIALDDKDAEAHCYLSEAKRVLDWDLAGADEELKRALQLDPNSPPAHLFAGLHPLFRGDVNEGLRLILEAQKLDPVSPIISYVATAACLANDRMNDAVVEGQRTLQLDPNYFYLDSVLAAAYREMGNFHEAIALYTKAQEARHLPSSGLAITYARMGNDTEARNILGQLLQAREERYVSAPLIAAVEVALGDKERAFQELERGYAEHSGVLQWIAFLPEFRALHSDPRFPQLVQRVNASQDTILKIIDTTLSEINDPNAQSHLTLKVGVKPRPGTQNGHVVRIKIDFYDLTKDNKFEPTNARVSYNWSSSSRDWTDPTPKYLAATYLRPKSKPASPGERRFGGFVVRVYFDGELQDSRASPLGLLTIH